MSTTEAHTPTPWVLSNNGFAIYSGDGVPILVADIADHLDAAFIVLACNSFDALTEANKKLVAALEKAQHRLDALRAYVPAHMLAAYLLDKDEITDAALKVTP